MSSDTSTIIFDFRDELRLLRDHLQMGQDRLVLVESCTAGMASGLLGQIPGISQFLCGSIVVYRNDSKHQWLGIENSLLEDPKIGPVSAEVTKALANSALERTPEATIAAAITGHLGPNSPNDLDGIVFTSVVRRRDLQQAHAIQHRLLHRTPRDSDDWHARQQRQFEAVRILYVAMNNAFGVIGA